MFAKLKQKLNVDTVAGGDRPEMTPDKYGSMAADMKGLRFSPHKDSGSDADSTVGVSSPSSSHGGESMGHEESKEEVLYMLMKRTEQVKKLERKVGDLAAIIREKTKHVERLELTVETERLASSQRIQELEKEKESSLAAGKEERRSSLIKQEQLKCQEASLVECRAELQQKTESALLAEQKAEDLLARVGRLEQQLSGLTQQRDQMQEDIKKKGSIIEELTCERQSLKKSVDKMQETSTTKARDLSNLTKTHAELQDAHQKLQHSMELHQQRMSNLLEEKDEQLSHATERAQSLEQRLQDINLSDDDRFTALEIERNSLELRLTETREQLIQVKSTWSDKITLLEKQIANLNAKMAEDSEEFRMQNSHAERQINELTAQVALLTDQLANADKAADAKQLSSSEQCRSLELQNEALKVELEQHKEKYAQMEATLNERISSLESQTKALLKARDEEKAKAQQKIAQIESRQSEWLEKEIDSEKHRTELEERLAQIQQENEQIKKDNEKLLTDIEKRKEEIQDLTKMLADLEANKTTAAVESEEMHSLLKATELELQLCNKEKSELLLRNAQLFQDVETQRSLAHAAQAEMEHVEKQAQVNATQLQSSIAYHKERADTMELEKQKDQVNPQEVDRLHSQLAALDTQLTDKNKTIKMQQQRLTDLKKTLQRELKLQTLPNGSDPLPDVPLSRAASEDTLSSRQTPPSVTASTSAILPLSNSPCSVLQATELNGVDGERITAHCERPCCSGVSQGRTDGITDVNFQYLKHVMLKFMLSRESEAKQLIKAVSTLLQFTQEEQTLIQQTLNWKTSWFAMRPPVGHGQQSHVVPSPY